MVKDKINYRARGPNTFLTRQPVQGRANDGGLRIGEMERDGVLAHGMSYFLNESFMIRGGNDEYFMAVCNKTGAIAIYNGSRNIFLSPHSDGPIEFNINPDESMNIKNISRFGRSFSILRIPYSFKLLMQELEAMNVKMRIITDENVDQLMGMSYSDNIATLLKTNKTILSEVVEEYTNQVSEKMQNVEKAIFYNTEKPEMPTPISSPMYQPSSEEFQEGVYDYNVSPAYRPGSPAYDTGSPGYDPGSPAYQPGSDEYRPSSPAYQPRSPDYQPRSPEYQPRSPAYQPGSPEYQPRTPEQQYSTPDFSPPSDLRPGLPISPPQQNMRPNSQTLIIQSSPQQISPAESILQVENEKQEQQKEVPENINKNNEKVVNFNIPEENKNEESNKNNTKTITL